MAATGRPLLGPTRSSYGVAPVAPPLPLSQPVPHAAAAPRRGRLTPPWLRLRAAATAGAVAFRRALPVLRVQLRRQTTPARLEQAVGLCLIAALGWGTSCAWQAYDASIGPYARSITNLPPPQPPSVRADDPAEVRRWREVMAKLGEAATYRDAKRQDWANEAVQRVLELDPHNAEARAMQTLWALEPAPTLTPDEDAARHQETRVVELLGAAVAFVEAGQPHLAEPLLRQVLALDPANATAHELLGRVPPRR